MKISKILALIALCALTFPAVDVPVGGVCAAYGAETSAIAADTSVQELYQVRPVRIDIPFSILEDAAKANTKIWTESKLYIEVSKNGNGIWRSPKQDITKGQNSFSFSDNNRFSLLFKKGDAIDVRVFVADNEALVRAERAGVGAGGGAAVGAGIGATITGCLTGGFGAPVGALIGGAIGAVCGTAGALIPVDGAVEVANFNYDSLEAFFGTKNEESRVRRISGIRESVCVANFTGRLMSDFKKKPGELEQQKNYIVRFRKIYLSSSDEGVKSGKYYLKIKAHDFEHKVNLGEVSRNEEVPIEMDEDKLLVLKNRLGESRLEIYRDIPYWSDKCVFSASQGASDGSTWLFMGCLSEDGKKSWIEVETLGEK